MEPRIRYCATPAGRVAYSAAGAGPALSLDSGWVSRLRGQLELRADGELSTHSDGRAVGLVRPCRPAA